MAVDTSKMRTGIVLQGGGALGAYEFGVIKALYEQRPGFKPTVVSGTSIGAITAAVLVGARGDPMAALDRLWGERLPVPPPLPGYIDPTSWWPPAVRRSLAALGNPGMYRLRAEWLCAPWSSTSIYDTGPLWATLDDLVDLDKLNDGETHVIVGAIDIATAEGKYFDNGERPLSFEDVVASASLPPGFPMTRIGDDSYWDGGLFSNTPLSPAINALEGCDADDPSITRELIVVELFPMTGAVPGTMPDVLERMIELRYTSRLKLDQKFFDMIDGQVELFQKIDAELPANSAIRNEEAYKKMVGHRRIDNFIVVSADFPRELSHASDFSQDSIRARIQLGHDHAMARGIGGGKRESAHVGGRQPPARGPRRAADGASLR